MSSLGFPCSWRIIPLSDILVIFTLSTSEVYFRLLGWKFVLSISAGKDKDIYTMYTYPGVWSVKRLAGAICHIVSSSTLWDWHVERERRCSTFNSQSREAQCTFFIFKLEVPTALILLLLFRLLCVFLVLKTALSHSHVRGLYGKKGMVSRCECVFVPWLFKGTYTH